MVEQAPLIKCVIWDLDGTLWPGTLAEGDRPQLHPELPALMEELDRRGVLQSVASRADERAHQALRAAGVAQYLLHPQLGPQAKSGSVQEIAQRLNLGLDALLLVDNDPFERAEVRFAHPQVRTLDAAQRGELLDLPGMPQEAATGQRRRLLYQQEEARQQAQASFQGPPEAFLRTLGLHLRLRRACLQELRRAQELTQRTHQLNTTGVTYSALELEALLQAPDHRVALAHLRDRWGDYGAIGLAVLRLEGEAWTLKLMLLSCRVMNRGISGAMLAALVRWARQQGHSLRADFVRNPRNRPMWLTYRLAGFQTLHQEGPRRSLQAPQGDAVEPPPWVQVEVDL